MIKCNPNNHINLDKVKKDTIRQGAASDVLEFNVVYNRKEKLHPTQKKLVELLEYLIKTYSNDNDVVIDNCMGSGSTGIACINTNRDFIGIELDKKYFDIAKERLNYDS